MTMKKIVSFLLAGTMALGLTGMGTVVYAEDGAKKITVLWPKTDSTQVDVMENYIQPAMAERFPDLEFEYIPMTADSPVKTMSASGDLPDIFFTGGADIDAILGAGDALDVSEYVEKDGFEKAGNLMQIFFMGDDYGTQTSLLYSPEMFRRFIKPRLKKLYDLAKSYGYIVQQHSCGSVVGIIPDLIEIGLDGLHPIQVSATGMELGTLKAQFGDKLYFAGSMDAMHLLIDGTKEEVEARIKETMELFDEGGFIFGPSQGFLPEIPVDRIIMMYELGYKYGRKEFSCP